MGLVDHFQRRNAHRTTGPMHKFHFGRQQVIKAILNDGVCLTAAHFHQDPRFGNNAAELANDFLGERFVTVLVEIFHKDSSFQTSGTSSSASCSISSRSL